MLEQRYAVLIASSRFPDEPRLEDLRLPENDVDGLNEVLTSESQGEFGFTETFILKNLSSYEILPQIERILSRVERDDLILVYYSGHGKLSQSGRLHLATANTRVSELLTTSIPVEDILTLIDHSRSTKSVLILDCCYSGAIGDTFRARGDLDEQLQMASSGRGLYVLTGSTGIQTSLEKESDDYGVFTKTLIEGLRGGEADLDGDGLIDMDELYRYSHSQMRGEGAQEPMSWGIELRGDPLIIGRSGRIPRVERANRVRERILDLAGQGALPDDILVRILEIINREQAELTKLEQSYDTLLDEILQGKLRVFEFIDRWRSVPLEDPPNEADQPPQHPPPPEKHLSSLPQVPHESLEDEKIEKKVPSLRIIIGIIGLIVGVITATVAIVTVGTGGSEPPVAVVPPTTFTATPIHTQIPIKHTPTSPPVVVPPPAINTATPTFTPTPTQLTATPTLTPIPTQPTATPTLRPTPTQLAVAPTPTNVVAFKDVIRFHDGQWQTIWINNAIAMYITKHGYGYPVESIEGTTVTMQVALPRGDLDVNMEMWRANIIDWVNEQVAERTIVDLGQIFERSTQGWYVPTYMIEGDAERGIDPVAPDLKTVADLVKYKELFADPEDSSKGLLVNCIIGWRCQQINRIKLNTYGLDTDYNLIEPGAAAGIDATIAGAHKNGKPVLSFYWEPTWLLGAYKMTLLEEPAYTEECNAAIQAVIPDFTDESVADQACAYEDFDVHKFVSSDLLQRAPDVAAFLSRMFVGTDRLNELSAYMELNDVTADETAFYFLQTYEDQWRTWVPQNVFDNVKASLN